MGQTKQPAKQPKKSGKRPGGPRPQDARDPVPHPHDGNQLVHGGRQKSGESSFTAEEEQGDGMPAVGGQR